MAWGPKCWIARYLKPGHEFQIGNDIWKLSGSPINEAEYEDLSRAVYECRLVHGREGIKPPAVVKIWMQTPEINTYDDQIHASEFHLGSPGQSVSASSLVSAGNSYNANHSDVASHLGSASHLSSVDHLSSARNSDSVAHSFSVDFSHSAGNSNIAGHLDSASHSGPLSNPDTANEEDRDEEILRQNAERCRQKKVEIPSKPFPHAIGLARYEQERNFPVRGGYLVYLVMENYPVTVFYQEYFGESGIRVNVMGFDGLLKNRQCMIGFIPEEGCDVLMSFSLIRKLGVENGDKSDEEFIL
ncbi:hypothetical protein EAF04_004325 [Stromatinia cepivora]|nr:hypothetical protein EAF04_004325 [Stromatinia cepivora]